MRAEPSAWAFVKVAGEVFEGDTESPDRRILPGWQPERPSDPVGPQWFEEAARDITGLGGHTILVLVVLASVAYLLLTKKRGAAFLMIAAVGGGMLLSSLLKLGFERPRPDLVPHGARVYTASFPSGHAMLSAVTYPPRSARSSRGCTRAAGSRRSFSARRSSSRFSSGRADLSRRALAVRRARRLVAAPPGRRCAVRGAAAAEAR